MTGFQFTDRREAGRLLARELAGPARSNDAVVVAVAPGGVPVGHEVASALGAPLEVIVVRRLSVPGQEGVTMGAVASGAVLVVNEEVVGAYGVDPSLLETVAAHAYAEVARRERLYRGQRTPADLRGRTVILVDDGIATGTTALAAVRALRRDMPGRLVVASPAVSAAGFERLAGRADEIVYVISPEPFWAVSAFYEDFAIPGDAEVRALLLQPTRRAIAEASP